MGNPLKSEVAAFRWLVAVVIGAVTVILVAKLISSAAGLIWGMILIGIVSVYVIKGMIYMMGSPDDDDPEETEPELTSRDDRQA